MVQARTLQFQQQQIASGNIPIGRVEQISQEQKKAEEDYQNKLALQKAQAISSQQQEQSRYIKAQEDYRQASSLANVYLRGGIVKGSEYLRLNPEARVIYRDIIKGVSRAPIGDTVQVEGIGGFSVAPELQEDFAKKYYSKGYNVETGKFKYIQQPQPVYNKPQDEVVIDYEGYSVARERQAPFILNRLGREQVALKKEQEKYYKVNKIVKQNNDLLFTPFVRKANIFLGTQFDKAYEFTKGSAKESFNILYTNSGLRSLSNKQKQSESYKRSVKAKEEREEFYFKRREKLKESTGLDFEVFGESIASPISFGITNLGTTFPKAKEGLGAYFEKNPEQLIFTKLGINTVDWLVVGKLFPKVGKLPEEIRVSKPFKTKGEATKGGDIKLLDKPNMYAQETKFARRFAKYSTPNQEGGILYGKEFKRTYAKPKTVIQKGVGYLDQEGRAVFVAQEYNIKRPSTKDYTIGIGKGRIEEPGNLNLDKQLRSLLDEKRTLTVKKTRKTRDYFVKDLGVLRLTKPNVKFSKSVDDNSLISYRENEQFFEADLVQGKLWRAKTKDVTDIEDFFVKDLGVIRVKKPMKELDIDFKIFNGKRISRAKVRGVQAKEGEGPLGETWAYQFNIWDKTYPRIARRMRPTKVDLVKDKGYPELSIDKNLIKPKDGIITKGYYDMFNNKIVIGKKGDVNTYLHELGHSKYLALKKRILYTKEGGDLFSPLYSQWAKTYTELEKKGVVRELKELGYYERNIPEEAIVRLYAAKPKSSLFQRIKLGMRYPETNKYLNRLLKYEEFKYPSKEIIKAQSRGKNTIIEKKESFEERMPRRFPKTTGKALIQKEPFPTEDFSLGGQILQQKAKPKLSLEVITKAQMAKLAQKVKSPSPVSPIKKSKATSQITDISPKPSISAFYGKGTYERTEATSSIISPSRTSLDLRQSYSTILRSSPQSIVRVQQKESSGMKEQLRNLELTRQLENTRQVELLRQQPRLKEQLRSSTLQAFKMPTPTRPSITPRVRPPIIPTPRTPRVVKPKFNFKLKSPKVKSIFGKRPKDSFEKYTPSYAALALNIRSKKKPTRTKGGYFFGFRPILD